MVAELVGGAGGTFLGAVVSWAMTTRTLKPPLERVQEALLGIRRELDQHQARIGSLEQLHMDGSRLRRRATDREAGP